MSIQTGIVAFHQASNALVALVANRAYPLTAPQGVTLPYYLFQRVSTVQRVGSHAGDSALEQVRYQFTPVATTAMQADAIADALKAALLSYRGVMGDMFVSGVRLANDLDDFEPTTQTYRRLLDFTLWYRPVC